jgi:hypothetical protein
MCVDTYAQRSLNSDDVFVFDNMFGKSDFSKRFKSKKDQVWDYWVHEFAFYEGAGYSGIAGLANGGFGNNVGFAYICNFLPPDWAILVGAELGIYSSKYTNVDVSKGYTIDQISIPSLNIEGPLRYLVDIQGANETSRVFMVNVPIMARYLFSVSMFGSATGQGGYQFGSPDVHTFYVAAGVKIGIPMYSKYTSSYSEANVYMVNDATSQEHTGQPSYGLKNDYGHQSWSGKYTLGTSVMFSVEFGYMLPLIKMVYNRPWHDKVRFYGGIFFDYGLNPLAPLKPAPLMYSEKNVDNAGNLKPEFVSITATNPMNNMTVGFKITASFSMEPKARY